MKYIALLLVVLTGLALATDAFVNQASEITFICYGSRDSGKIFIAPPESGFVDTVDAVVDTYSCDTVLVAWYTPYVEGRHRLRGHGYSGNDTFLAAGDWFVEHSPTGIGAYSINMSFLNVADTSGLSGIRPQVWNLGRTIQYIKWKSSDANGLVSVSLDSAQYRVEVNENGYERLVDTMHVNGSTGSFAFYLTAFSPGAPADTGMCRVYGWVGNIIGDSLQAVITVAPRERLGQWVHAGGRVIFVDAKTTTSDSTGYFSIDVWKSQMVTNDNSDSLKYDISITKIGYSRGYIDRSVALTDSVYQVR